MQPRIGRSVLSASRTLSEAGRRLFDRSREQRTVVMNAMPAQVPDSVRADWKIAGV